MIDMIKVGGLRYHQMIITESSRWNDSL